MVHPVSRSSLFSSSSGYSGWTFVPSSGFTSLLPFDSLDLECGSCKLILRQELCSYSSVGLFLFVGICNDLDCGCFHGVKKVTLLIDSYRLTPSKVCKVSLDCCFEGNHLLPLAAGWKDEISCRFGEISEIILHQNPGFRAVTGQYHYSWWPRTPGSLWGYISCQALQCYSPCPKT